MTTKSTVAQLIVADYFREQIEESEEEEESVEEAEVEEEPPGKDTSGENGQNGEKSELDEVLEKYSEYWYEPDGQKNNYAIDPPEGVDDKRRYYKTKREAVKRLKQWFA